VAVTGIETWSLCAHHLLPFSASISVGYLAESKVLGLSKFSRLAHFAAHRPTSQEALVNTLADLITEATGTENVAVKATGLHLCMAMRGVREQTAKMTTQVLRGAFRADQSVREEWTSIAGK
jgi:GTP cyclohydrolase I